MKKIIFLFPLLLLISFALAEEQPPSLNNHQFYGFVYWDAYNSTAPTTVIAKIGSTEYSSTISKNPNCPASTCQGTYGSDSDNILRVQGNDNDIITFYLDAVPIPGGTKTYQSNQVEKLDFNIASEPFECTPDWQYSAWTNNDCGTRTGTDLNQCNPDQINKTEEISCQTSSSSSTQEKDDKEESPSGPCVYFWDCSKWSSCSNSFQTRTCQRIDDCDQQFADNKVSSVIKYDKPVEKKACLVGKAPQLPLTPPSTPPPSKEPTPVEPTLQTPTPKLSTWHYIAGAATLVIIIAVVIFLVWWQKHSSLDENVKQQLASVYQRGQKQGQTQDQVTQKLLNKGWDESIINKFLKSR